MFSRHCSENHTNVLAVGMRVNSRSAGDSISSMTLAPIIAGPMSSAVCVQEWFFVDTKGMTCHGMIEGRSECPCVTVQPTNP